VLLDKGLAEFLDEKQGKEDEVRPRQRWEAGRRIPSGSRPSPVRREMRDASDRDGGFLPPGFTVMFSRADPGTEAGSDASPYGTHLTLSPDKSIILVLANS